MKLLYGTGENMARNINEIVNSLLADRRRRMEERVRELISKELSLRESIHNDEIKPMSKTGDSDAAQRSNFSPQQRAKK